MLKVVGIQHFASSLFIGRCVTPLCLYLHQDNDQVNLVDWPAVPLFARFYWSHYCCSSTWMSHGKIQLEQMQWVLLGPIIQNRSNYKPDSVPGPPHQPSVQSEISLDQRNWSNLPGPACARLHGVCQLGKSCKHVQSSGCQRAQFSYEEEKILK
jgi:hypothetical protein